MLRKTLCTFAIATLLPSAWADQNAAVNLVQQLAEDTQENLADNDLSASDIDRIMDEIDVDGVAAFVLGKYAETTTAEEYDAYEIAFRTYLRGQLQTHVEKFAGVGVQVTDTAERGSQSIVETRVTKADGETAEIKWRLRRSGAGWQVIDIEAMDLWLAIEQRAQFVAELDQNGGDISALISTLKSKS